MQRNRERTKRFELGVSGFLALRLLAAFVAGFLVGKVNIANSIFPFGAAYMLSAFLCPHAVNPYMAAGGVLTALAYSVKSMDNPAYSFAVVAISAALMILAVCLKLPMGLRTAGLAACIAYGICTVAFKLSLLMGILSSLIELIITLLMIVVMTKVFTLVELRVRRRIFTEEEVISICFMGMICVMGMGNIGYAGVYLREISAVLLMLAGAYLGGAALGAATGVTAALACVIAGSGPAFVGLMGLTGMAAGACNNFGKAGTAIGALMVELFGAFYVFYDVMEVGSVGALVIGAVAFLFVPLALLKRLGRYVDINLLRDYDKHLKEERFRDLTVGRLKKISHVFNNAAKVFAQSAQRNEWEGISYMIAGIPEKSCAQCAFFKNCWDKEFEATYELMQDLYTRYTEGKTLHVQDLGTFINRCIQPERLLDAAREVFCRYETNRLWEGKIARSRSMIGDQMHGVARVIDSLTKEVQVDMEFRRDIEENIRLKADLSGISVREAAVVLSGGTITTDIVFKSARPETAERALTDVVSEACGLRMKQTLPPRPYGGKNLYQLHFEQTRACDVETGVATITKESSPITGDAHSREMLRDGRFMMVLCDGMGSGERAARESRIAVSLMEDFYRAEFDDETVLDAINKLLILSSSDEIFSTMDLVMVDLVESKMKVTKIGAPHSYVINEKGMRKLQAGSLPMGILEDYKPIVYEMDVKPGDVIVLFTDGVADLESVDDGLHEVIRAAAKTRNAKEMAEKILGHALAAYGGKAPDDLTVMVGRIVR